MKTQTYGTYVFSEKLLVKYIYHDFCGPGNA